MISENDIECFAQRILNPFRGAMHIVRLKWSEAVTTDGKQWTLYVRGEKFYDDLQESNDEHIIVPDIKYGQWSEADDFSRSPIRLTTFYDEIDFEGEKLLQAVKNSVSKLPFPYIDHHELWLLDETTQHPLALIASRCDHEIEEMPALIQWTPGHAATRFFPELAILQQQVRHRAGKSPVARWFNRRKDELPPLELDTALLENVSTQIAQLDEWQSPYRLLLKLEKSRRIVYEKLASRHAMRLVELLSLYPEFAQPRLITAAQVEARMRKSLEQETASTQNDDSIPPFYLEMDD